MPSDATMNQGDNTPSISTDNEGGVQAESADGDALRNCLLSQYRFCTAGIGIGTAYSLRYRKGFVPMLAAGAIGTSVDLMYGLLVECAHLRSGQGDDAGGDAEVIQQSNSSGGKSA